MPECPARRTRSGTDIHHEQMLMRSVASDVAAYLTEKKSSAKFAARLVTVPWTSPIGRLPLMTEEGRPTGIRYEDAVDAARRGGNVDFEGRKVRLVSINTKSEIHAPHPARLLLDLGDEYLVIDGYFSGDEFIEEGRQRRSKE